MNRRGFLQRLGLGGAAVVAGAATKSFAWPAQESAPIETTPAEAFTHQEYGQSFSVTAEEAREFQPNGDWEEWWSEHGHSASTIAFVPSTSGLAHVMTSTSVFGYYNCASTARLVR